MYGLLLVAIMIAWRLRLWSHRSIRYTVFAIRYAIWSPPLTRFRSFHATSLECRLWRRANRIAYTCSEYRIAYTSMITALRDTFQIDKVISHDRFHFFTFYGSSIPLIIWCNFRLTFTDIIACDIYRGLHSSQKKLSSSDRPYTLVPTFFSFLNKISTFVVKIHLQK